MPNYYLDIETTGLQPHKDKIITIQFMELDAETAEPRSELTILKEWESSERRILAEFIERSGIRDDHPFAFVPVGYNLNFEHNFFLSRCFYHKMGPLDILKRPYIDLRPFGVIMNRGRFTGSGLDKITGKESPGAVVPQLYEQGKHDEILSYIKNETESFVEFAQWLYKELPKMLERFRSEKV